MNQTPNHKSSLPIPHPPEIRGLLRYYRISDEVVGARAGCHYKTVAKFFGPMAIRMVSLTRHRIRQAITELLAENGYVGDLTDSRNTLDRESEHTAVRAA